MNWKTDGRRTLPQAPKGAAEGDVASPRGKPSDADDPALYTRLEIPAITLRRLAEPSTSVEFADFAPPDVSDLAEHAGRSTSVEFAITAQEVSDVRRSPRNERPPSAAPAADTSPGAHGTGSPSKWRASANQKVETTLTGPWSAIRQVGSPSASSNRDHATDTPAPVGAAEGQARSQVVSRPPAMPVLSKAAAEADTLVAPDRASVSGGLLSLPPAGTLGTQIFRKQALRAYEEGERLTTALRATPPASWVTLLCVVAALGTAVVVCALCSIDIVARGPGILRSPGGARSVAARVSGSVESVAVAAGREVKAGEVIATIESSSLQSERLAAQRRVELIERKLARLASTDAKLVQQNIDLIKRDQALTRERIRSQQHTLATLAAQGQAIAELSGQGIVARVDGAEAEERLREVDRTRLTLQQQLTQGQIGLTSLQREQIRDYETTQTEYEVALAQREAIDLRLRESQIVAPQAGRIESVVIKAGELVPEGGVVATLVPLEAPSQVIAYVADRDRAFLKAHARARLELNQLPSGEFGTLIGHVTDVSTGFATGDEIRSVLSDVNRVQELSYRVDIRLDDDAKTREILSKLRSGTLVTAHVVTRSRRIISLLFDPLRPYFE